MLLRLTLDLFALFVQQLTTFQLTKSVARVSQRQLSFLSANSYITFEINASRVREISVNFSNYLLLTSPRVQFSFATAMQTSDCDGSGRKTIR